MASILKEEWKRLKKKFFKLTKPLNYPNHKKMKMNLKMLVGSSYKMSLDALCLKTIK